MPWQQVPLIEGAQALCYENGQFLVTARRDRLYYAWNLHRRRLDGTIETLDALRFELCDFPNVEQGLAWADLQLADLQQVGRRDEP